jgi:hypothetical protein
LRSIAILSALAIQVTGWSSRGRIIRSSVPSRLIGGQRISDIGQQLPPKPVGDQTPSGGAKKQFIW